MKTEESVREASLHQLARVDANSQLAPKNIARIVQQTSPSALVQLTTRLFFRENAPRTIAMVSCKTREDVHSLSSSYRDFLISVGVRVTLMQASDCLDWGRPRPSLPGGAFGWGPGPSDIFLAAKKESNVVLVNCGSLEGSPALLMLASHVDGIVLVVEDGRNSAREMQEAVRLIKDVNGIVLGVVLTKGQRVLPNWLSNLFSRRNR